MVAKKVVLKNREGLHVRPAGLFSNEMQRFLSDVWVCHNESVVSGKSIMNLIARGSSAAMKWSCVVPALMKKRPLHGPWRWWSPVWEKREVTRRDRRTGVVWCGGFPRDRHWPRADL